MMILYRTWEYLGYIYIYTYTYIYTLLFLILNDYVYIVYTVLVPKISNHRLRDTTPLNVTGVTSVFRVLRLFRLPLGPQCGRSNGEGWYNVYYGFISFGNPLITLYHMKYTKYTMRSPCPWWFETLILLSIQLGTTVPTDFNTFFRGGETTSQSCLHKQR